MPPPPPTCIMQFWKPCPKFVAKIPGSFWWTMENAFKIWKLSKQIAFLKVFLAIGRKLFSKIWLKKMSLMVQKSLLSYGPEMKTVYNFFNFFVRLNAVVTNLLINSYQPSEGFCAKFRRVLLNYMFFDQKNFSSIFPTDRYIAFLTTVAKKFCRRSKRFLLNFSEKYAQKFFSKVFLKNMHFLSKNFSG